MRLPGLACNGHDTTMVSSPRVDERIELLSIVFRLAGNQEYNSEEYKEYAKDINSHFSRYKNHPLIQFAKLLADSNSVGYDAVMCMAVHVTGRPFFLPIVPFSDTIPEKRWGKLDALKFDSLLRKFYTDAHCDEFFANENKLYKNAERSFQVLYGKLDAKWYKEFYGQVPDSRFNLAIGLCNGGSNYGVKVDFPGKQEQIYAIIGAWTFDNKGSPVFPSKKYLPTLIHEFSHSFVNNLVNKNEAKFKKAGIIIYSRDTAIMARQAYAEWKTMISESLVRASVIEYLKVHDQDGKAAEKQIKEELGNGFLWMRELVSLVDSFVTDRKRYPTFEAFMPRIENFYNRVATHLDDFANNFDRLRPHVSFLEPFQNNTTDVDPSLAEISIKFDKRMQGKGHSFSYGEKGKGAFPITKVIGYNDDKTILKINVSLKPDTDYQFIITGLSFHSTEDYPLVDYVVNFRTKK
jgi:hypothetical protein